MISIAALVLGSLAGLSGFYVGFVQLDIASAVADAGSWSAGALYASSMAAPLVSLIGAALTKRRPAIAGVLLLASAMGMLLLFGFRTWAATPAVLAALAGACAVLTVRPIHERELFVFDRISAAVGKTAGWCIVILTFVTSYEVFSRYIFNAPTEWAFDASYMLYGTLFMLAGAYALSRNGHVRGDFLYRSWSPRRQAGMDLVLYCLFFFPGMLAFIYAGFGFAKLSWLMHEHSSASPNGPPVYQFKSLISIVGFLMVLQGLAEVIRCVLCLRTGAWPRRLHDVEELERVILVQAAQKKAEGLDPQPLPKGAA